MATPMRVSRFALCLARQREESVLQNCLIQCCRCYSTHETQDIVKQPGLIRRYLVDKTINIVNDSTSRLEKAYPTVFQIYKTFNRGLRGFVKDSREYYRVSTDLWSGRDITDLTRHELEILRQVPNDFLHIIPVLVVSCIPGGSFAFPIAYMFPRTLLSYHFWTDQQRYVFWQHELKHRLQHMQPILDHMQLMSRHIQDSELEDKIVKVVNKLRHSVHPTVPEVLEVMPLFESYPYNLSRITIAYSRHLSKLMKMSLRRRLLKQEALLLHYTDMAMMREGIYNLTDFELERACFWRGLNPVGLSRKDRLGYLQYWLEVSKTLNEERVSLLLHLPVLLAFCHPTNRELMGGWRYKFRFRRP